MEREDIVKELEKARSQDFDSEVVAVASISEALWVIALNLHDISHDLFPYVGKRKGLSRHSYPSRAVRQ
jgi:hypothetical protein